MSSRMKCALEDYVHEKLTTDQKSDIDIALAVVTRRYGEETVRKLLRYSCGYSDQSMYFDTIIAELSVLTQIHDESLLSRNLTQFPEYVRIKPYFENTLREYAQTWYDGGE